MIRAARPSLLLAVASLCLFTIAACSGGDKSTDGDDDDDGSSPTSTPTPPPGIGASARVVKGPGGATSFAPAVSAFGGVGPVNGHWNISPDRARLTLVNITFNGPGGAFSSSDFTDCVPEYDRTDPALTEIADCAFDILPGTYDQIGIGVLTTAEIFVNDPVNGFYTDPTAPTGVSITPPGGGADFVKMVIPGPGGIGNVLSSVSFLPEPFVVTSSSTGVAIDIVVDMLHTVAFDVTGATVTIYTAAPSPPANLVPALAGAGARYEFYTPTGTAGNVPAAGPTDNDSGSIRLFYAAPPQPSYVFSPVPGPSQAYAVDPTGGTGPRAGGWLGLDASGYACWALPAESFEWASYDRVCRMMVLGTVGQSTTLECDITPTPPPPLAGSTYESGCPDITDTDVSRSVELVAN